MKFLAVTIGIVLALAIIRIVRRRVGQQTLSIDAFTLSEPWRRSVADAQSVERRYAATIRSTDPGPLQDRLQAIKLQVHKGVEECWHIAKRGDELDENLTRLRMSSLTEQRSRAADEDTRASLDRQIASVDRIKAMRDDTDRQLRLLTTRLGELVTQAAEITTSGVDSQELGSSVDDVVTQLEALRLAVDDLNGPGSGAAGQVQPPL